MNLDVTPNYSAAQLMQSTDLIRLAGIVDYQLGYTELAIISGALIHAAHNDSQLRRAMENLAAKILQEEETRYIAMGRDRGYADTAADADAQHYGIAA